MDGDHQQWGRGCTSAGMDGDEDEVLRGRLRMEFILAGTVGDGDHCSSPCSSPFQSASSFSEHEESDGFK